MAYHNNVRAKKYLGQHFLNDDSIAENIVEALDTNDNFVIEVGAGTGVLSKFLLPKYGEKLKLIDVDEESVNYLLKKYPEYAHNIALADFLKMDLKEEYNDEKINIIGNFPYNISTQIYFKILENLDMVDQAVGMLQKEVAYRIASKEGSKVYGILSVLVQVYYNVELLFNVQAESFTPPPKVESTVLKITRNSRKENKELDKSLKIVVKAAFNQRRKMMRNSLKPYFEVVPEKFQTLRPEQVNIEDFLELAELHLNQ